jgi:hypothetical protein
LKGGFDVGSRARIAAAACLVASGLLAGGAGASIAFADPSDSGGGGGKHTNGSPSNGVEKPKSDPDDKKTTPDGDGKKDRPGTDPVDADNGRNGDNNNGDNGVGNPGTGNCGNSGGNGGAQGCGGGQPTVPPPTDPSTPPPTTQPEEPPDRRARQLRGKEQGRLLARMAVVALAVAVEPG